MSNSDTSADSQDALPGNDGDNRTSSPVPTLPPAPDPSNDPGVVPPISSPPAEDGGTPEELDLFTLKPVATLKMLCRSIDTLVKVTGDIPPTPPLASREHSSDRGVQDGPSQSAGCQGSGSGDQIDGVPFTKTPIGSPEAHVSEPSTDIGANAEPIHIQQGIIARKFYSKRPPPISTTDYLMRMHKYCPMSTAVYLSTSLYIYRLAVKDRVISVTPRNVHRLLLAGLRVAMKALEDHCWQHSRFAKVGGVSEAELGRLEITFCYLIGFELKVDADMLRQEIETLTGSAVQDSPIGADVDLKKPAKGEKRKASSTLPSRPAMPMEVYCTPPREEARLHLEDMNTVTNRGMGEL